jgi:hypothetical protein
MRSPARARATTHGTVRPSSSDGGAARATTATVTLGHTGTPDIALRIIRRQKRASAALRRATSSTYRLQNVNSKSTSRSKTMPRSAPAALMKRMLSAYLLALISGTQASSRGSVSCSSCATLPLVSIS